MTSPLLGSPTAVGRAVPTGRGSAPGHLVARVTSSKNGARLRVDLEIEVNGILLQAQSFDALCSVELGEADDSSGGRGTVDRPCAAGRADLRHREALPRPRERSCRRQRSGSSPRPSAGHDRRGRLSAHSRCAVKEGNTRDTGSNLPEHCTAHRRGHRPRRRRPGAQRQKHLHQAFCRADAAAPHQK